MGHLLKIEWLKLKNYRTFWILSILFIISIYGINYVLHSIFAREELHSPGASIFVGGPPFQFPAVWQTVSYLSGFLLFFPGLLLIISVTNEFSFKTHRQNIIDGLSRWQFISIKMAMAVIISVVSTLIVFLTAWYFGASEGGAAFSTEGFRYLGYFFLQALGYCGLAVLFSILFRRSGITIGVFFLYSVILERMLSGLMNKYLGSSGYYLPLHSVDSLIPFPFFKTISRRLFTPPDVEYLLIAAGIYFVLYFFLIRRRFQTADL